MREKVILTDADGTIVMWLKGFREFMEVEKGFHILEGHETEYKMSKKYGLPSELMEKLIRDFNESHRIANLEPFADAQEYIGKLAEAGFRFICVTAQSDAPDAKVHRTASLLKQFGDVFEEIHCIGMGEHKEEMLSKWKGKDYFWIEDHPSQAEAGIANGLKTILISHEYNAHIPAGQFVQVSNETPWKEIYSIIMKDYGLL